MADGEITSIKCIFNCSVGTNKGFEWIWIWIKSRFKTKQSTVTLLVTFFFLFIACSVAWWHSEQFHLNWFKFSFLFCPTLNLVIFPSFYQQFNQIACVVFSATKYNLTSRHQNPKDKRTREGEFGTVFGGSLFPPFPAFQHTGVHINLSLAGRRATESSVWNPNKQIKMWNICQVWADGVRSQNSLLINCNWFCCTPLFSTGSLDPNSPAVCAAHSQISKKKK